MIRGMRMGVARGTSEDVVDGIILGVLLGMRLGVALGTSDGVVDGAKLGVILGVMLGQWSCIRSLSNMVKGNKRCMISESHYFLTSSLSSDWFGHFSIAFIQDSPLLIQIFLSQVTELLSFIVLDEVSSRYQSMVFYFVSLRQIANNQQRL
jgi:hypothetical protein